MEDLGPLFVPPSEPDRFWILVLLVSAPTILGALYALVRGRLPSALSMVSLFLLPVFTYLLGNLYLLEVSQKVSFCGSCHETMSPILDAIESDGSTLAAAHFQRGAVSREHACYQCHSGYGIWGGVHAKLAGVSHMWHTVTGNFEFPLQLHAPLNIDSCLNCHAQAVPFRSVEAHRDPGIQQMLLDRQMDCTGTCHPSAHPEAALHGAEAWTEKP